MSLVVWVCPKCKQKAFLSAPLPYSLPFILLLPPPQKKKYSLRTLNLDHRDMWRRHCTKCTARTSWEACLAQLITWTGIGFFFLEGRRGNQEKWDVPAWPYCSAFGLLISKMKGGGKRRGRAQRKLHGNKFSRRGNLPHVNAAILQTACDSVKMASWHRMGWTEGVEKWSFLPASSLSPPLVSLMHIASFCACSLRVPHRHRWVWGVEKRAEEEEVGQGN